MQTEEYGAVDHAGTLVTPMRSQSITNSGIQSFIQSFEGDAIRGVVNEAVSGAAKVFPMVVFPIMSMMSSS